MTEQRHQRHITEKELKIAAKQIGMKIGVVEYLIQKVRENQKGGRNEADAT